MDENLIVLIVGLALAISELLALMPKVKSNSIFTFIYNALKSFKKKQ